MFSLDATRIMTLRFAILSLTILGRTVFGAPSENASHIPTLDGRIVGGDDANIEEYPYQVSLLSFRRHVCGGSIISPSFVVTAAHCVYGSSVATLAVRAGSSLHNREGVVVNVQEIFLHPNYNTFTVDYDIAVLKLAEDLVFSASIGSVDLPDQDQEIVDGADCIVSGWGALAEMGIASDQLQVVLIRAISKDQCEAAYGKGMITPRMMCAGVMKGGKDSCQGDSGGPLIIEGQLIGVISWGEGCAEPSYPGVYSSVPTLRSFIKEVSKI